MTPREPFAPIDAAWLRMDDPTNLMMITGVLMFDEPLDYARLRDVIARRLVARFDRFSRRVARSQDSAFWEDDPHFTLDAHVHRIALPSPGDQGALQELVSDLMSVPLDFSKSPWQFHYVENFGSGSALVARLHHCIADGIALVHVLLSLTDAGAEEVAAAAAAVHRGPHRSALESGLAGALRAGSTLRDEGGELLDDPARIGELVRTGADGAAALGKLLFMPKDPRTPLKGPLGVRKQALWSLPIPLADVKAIGMVAGATINDILLAALAGALRTYLLSRGAAIDGLDIRAVVPVNLRPLDQPPTLGNRFGVVFLPLPVGLADPYDRLVALRERMEAIKRSPEAVVAFGILNVMGSSPAAAQELAVQMFGSKATAVTTNVPGPRETIYLAGSPVRGIMFWVPQSGRLGIGVSILSYAGSVLVGVAVDADLIPEPQQIVEGFHSELETLRGLMQEQP